MTKHSKKTRETEFNVPLDVRKIGIGEEEITDFMMNVFKDFNITHLKRDDALSMFYVIITTMIWHLDTYPNQFFKLPDMDIDSGEGGSKELLSISIPYRASKDIKNAQSIYNKYAGEDMIRKKLEKHIDSFAMSLIKKTSKVRRKRTRLKKTMHDKLTAYNLELKELNERIERGEELRSDEYRRRQFLESMIRTSKKNTGVYTNIYEKQVRERNLVKFQELEMLLRRRWIQDKNNFPL